MDTNGSQAPHFLDPLLAGRSGSGEIDQQITTVPSAAVLGIGLDMGGKFAPGARAAKHIQTVLKAFCQRTKIGKDGGEGLRLAAKRPAKTTDDGKPGAKGKAFNLFMKVGDLFMQKRDVDLELLMAQPVQIILFMVNPFELKPQKGVEIILAKGGGERPA